MQELYKEKISNAFPKNIHKDVEQVIILLSNKKFDVHSEVNQEVIVNGEKLNIPGRIYFEDIGEEEESALSELQRVILNCLYLSNHN